MLMSRASLGGGRRLSKTVDGHLTLGIGSLVEADALGGEDELIGEGRKSVLQGALELL